MIILEFKVNTKDILPQSGRVPSGIHAKTRVAISDGLITVIDSRQRADFRINSGIVGYGEQVYPLDIDSGRTPFRSFSLAL